MLRKLSTACMGLCLLSCLKQNEVVSSFEECTDDSCNTYIVNDGDGTSTVVGNPSADTNTINAPPEPDKYWRCITESTYENADYGTPGSTHQVYSEYVGENVLCQCDLKTLEEVPSGPSACLGFSCCFMTDWMTRDDSLSYARGDCECLDMNTPNWNGWTCEEILHTYVYDDGTRGDAYMVPYCGEVLE